jgi:YidC/Oxa1 family membrane protein insertase
MMRRRRAAADSESDRTRANRFARGSQNFFATVRNSHTATCLVTIPIWHGTAAPRRRRRRLAASAGERDRPRKTICSSTQALSASSKHRMKFYTLCSIAATALSVAECFQGSSFALSSSRNLIAERAIRPNSAPFRLAGHQHRLRRPAISAVAEGVEHANTVLNALDASTISWIQLLIADAAAAVDPTAATSGAAAAADTAAKSSPGLYDSFVNVIEQALILLHSALKTASVPGAWGTSIILFTVMVKAVTYPLNYKQMASTIQMQNLQPKIKALQSRYQSDPQKLNEMTAKLYQDEKINPLAGCIPTLIQIPIFIALYRSLLDLAKKDLLTESFLWVPSLEGPVGEYSPTTGLPIDGTAWLFKGWTEGHPAMGWEDTLAYLSIPIILVITQSLSQKVLQPAQSDDPAQQQTQQILKFLPLMIGWFSLNVPAGLGVYWVINNLLSTGQQYYIRQQVKGMQPAGGAAAAVSTSDESVREKLKEISSTKLRSAEDLKFKVMKKEDAAPATATAVEVSADADDGDKESGRSSPMRCRARRPAACSRSSSIHAI